MPDTDQVDTRVFHAIPAGESAALVAFSARGVKPGRFHLYKMFRAIPGYDKLLVRDPHASWYNAGLPGVGDSVEEIAAGIEREVARLGATRIVTFGFSMGGYAAILFGCMLGAERVISLCPQTLLDQGLRHAPPADVELQAPDLAPFVGDAPATQIDLVAGWDDHLDVFHAQRIARFPSVRVLALRNRVHAFARELADEGLFEPTMISLLEGSPPTISEVDPFVDADTERRIADTAYAMERGDWDTVARRIGPVAERNPGWAGPSFDQGRALAEMKDWPGAERACARALRANPRWKDARQHLVEALLASDKPEEAESVLQEGLALDEGWAYGQEAAARMGAR